MYKTLHRNRQAFTASTDDIKLPWKGYLKEMELSIFSETSAAANFALATALAILDAFELKAGGTPIIRISGPDLYALDHLFLGHHVFGIESGAGADQDTTVMGLRVPINLRRADVELTYRALFATQTNIQNPNLSVTSKWARADLTPKHLEYLTYNYTPAATGNYLDAVDMSLAGDLVGMLCFSTTIPTNTATTTSLDRLKLLVNGTEEIEDSWINMKADSKLLYEAFGQNTILDNYTFLDLSDSPIPGPSSVKVQVNAGDTNAIRFVPIVEV